MRRLLFTLATLLLAAVWVSILRYIPDGVVYNIDTFAPSLIAAVSHSPKLTYAQAEQLYQRYNIPVVNSADKSVEEIAVTVMQEKNLRRHAF